MAARFVDPRRAALVLVDVQPAFLDGMHGRQEPLLVRLEHLLMLAREFELPIVATFEHPVAEKGWLPERLERLFPDDAQTWIKRSFNLCGEPEITRTLAATGRDQLLVAGAETDVCVLQSVLGLLDAGYQVFLLEDCLFSAERHVGPALRRMESAGAVPLTYKTLHYELQRVVLETPLHERWNADLDGIAELGGPYDLPAWPRALIGR